MATVTPNFNWPVPTSTDLVKDGATAIEALGDSIDASLVDLKGGTSGQVLSKTSNTDMDFTWVAADDTNAIQNTIVDAKGDLIAASAADTPARLAVGANNYFLQAASGESTGLKWGGDWTTYTPTATAQAGTITSYNASGTYMRIGKMVTFMANIGIVNVGTAAGGGSLKISLPVTARTDYIFTIYGEEVAVTGKAITGSMGASIANYNETWVRFYDFTSALATSNVIVISGTYEAA
jgi:hypothetical protein